MDHLVIPVAGMTCGGCTASVEKALLRRDGVSTAQASLEQKTVAVDFDPARTSRAALVEAIQRAGFDAT
jgi:copper chaperone